MVADTTAIRRLRQNVRASGELLRTVISIGEKQD